NRFEREVSMTGPSLVLRDRKPDGTEVEVRPGLAVGGRAFVVMAGPCAVEDAAQMAQAAAAVAQAGCPVLRGGAYKPRTSPYAFQGLGAAGVRMLVDAADRNGLAAVSEIMEPADAMEGVAILQVGARNMHNSALLKALARQKRPVLLKRGLSATFEEWLLAAEYLLAGGNDQVILCERGIRTFETYTRNTMDLAAVPVLHQLTHLPVIVDPSHATGKRWLVRPLALGGVAVGADGVMVEVHPDPDSALSDSEQQLDLPSFAALMRDLVPIHDLARHMRDGYAAGVTGNGDELARH
ncbi:MAG TPA: 3-deoxy-7-phosphoheptulonate synthase, partial [Candidatus Dormibacteraeota bacterium]|nr:3-deoxy-7-phosphoheptulonate synthase [Candidatus Dormibacteraeota bacterium]